MIGKNEILVCGDFGLKPLYGFILELLDLAALDTDNMIMMMAQVQFKNRIATLEVMAHDQTGGFELCQNPIDRRQPDLLAFRDETFINLLRAKVTVCRFPVLKNLQNFEAR